MIGTEATPLHFAANKGHAKFIELLVQNKASVNERKSDGHTVSFMYPRNEPN